jgi:hypothetical protein
VQVKFGLTSEFGQYTLFFFVPMLIQTGINLIRRLFMKRNYLLLIILLFFLIIFGCKTSEISSKPASEKEAKKKVNLQTETLYTKYNIHIMNSGRDIKAHYTNWIGPFSGHAIVPFNTKVIFKNWPQGFILQRVDSGRNIYFYFNKQHMKMEVAQYINLITSHKKFSISNLSQLDKNGIKRGKASIGMTKKGVIVALGYPARHKTPSLKNKYWVYWQNKWLTKIIKFNNAGEVVSIVE